MKSSIGYFIAKVCSFFETTKKNVEKFGFFGSIYYFCSKV